MLAPLLSTTKKGPEGPWWSGVVKLRLSCLMCGGTRFMPQIPEIVGQAFEILDREATGNFIDVREPQALIVDQPLHRRGGDLGHVVDLEDLRQARDVLEQLAVLAVCDGHRF